MGPTRPHRRKKEEKVALNRSVRNRDKDLHILNPKKMKNFKIYSLLGKNFRFGASINRQI